MADLWAGEVSASMRLWGISTIVTPTSIYVEEPGRADVTGVRNGRAAFVEIKSSRDSSMPFSKWRTNQRDWAAALMESQPLSQYWLWIFIGKDSPFKQEVHYEYGVPVANWTKTKGLKKGERWIMPRRAWLVPYAEWISMEKFVRPHQLSLPYRSDESKNLVIRDNCWSAKTIFRKFELKVAKERVKSSIVWELPEKHPFASFVTGENEDD